MPLSRQLARRARAFNPLVAPFLTRLPSFGYLRHRGRKTGEHYVTPLRLIRTPDSNVGYIALTYGATTDWCQNILAKPATFDIDGQQLPIKTVELIERSTVAANLGALTRLGLSLLGVDQLAQVTFTKTMPFHKAVD